MKFTRSNTCNPTVATPKRCTGCEHITHHAHIPPTWLTQPPSSLPITSKSPPTMISCKISWADGLPGSFPRLHICTNQWVTASSLRNTKDKMTAWLPIYPVEEFKKLLIIASFFRKGKVTLLISLVVHTRYSGKGHGKVVELMASWPPRRTGGR